MKHVFFYALAASSLMFSACSSDDPSVAGTGSNQTNAVQEIALQVASSGDGLTTRAGRQLESSEAAQDIKNVKVFVCDAQNSVKYVKDYTDWMGDDATNYANGRQATFTIPEADKLSAGTYNIYAIGYSESSDYDLSSITDITKGGTFNENAAISLQDGKAEAEEIFAGSATLKVEEGKKASSTVTLNRQVAGTYGYVEDIPYVDGATELQLVASNSGSNLILGSFANIDITGNGENNGNNVKYVVNSANANKAQTVYTIDLTKWFTTMKDEDNNGLIDADTNWKGDASKYKNGSVFAGCFLFPFAKTDGQTFTLQLVKPNDAENPVRTWNVNLPASDGQLSEHSFTSWNGTAFTTANATDTKNAYSVVRNHLYGIGTRTSSKPNQPGTDPGDNPQSLKKTQDITLQVNDNWEVIHKMELE